MKHTDRYGVAAIANALMSLQHRITAGSRARRIVSRVGVVARRRFRAAVLLLLLASLFVSSTPSAPNSFGRVSADSGITTNLLATANRLAANLYQSLHDSYASTVNSLSVLEPKVLESSRSAFIPTPMLVLGAPTNPTVTSASNTSISLSWTAPGGAVDHYMVERSQSPQGPFTIIASPAATNHQDNTVSGGSAYLYRVRAVDSFGVASSASTMAVGTAISFEDPTLFAGTTPIKKQHIYDLRQAVNAVRALAGLSAFTWTDADLTGLQVQALHVQELRDKLDEALAALSVPVTSYQDSSLATGANGTPIRKIHIEQLRLRSTGGTSTSTGNVSSNGDSTIARLDPANETGGGGENPLSRNYNLNIPLLGLPGRAGLDLGLSLSYNSLVWTRNGSYISFDDDAGFPSAGFRLGFPVIQAPYYNSQVGKNAFLLIGSDGSRTELRQVNSSALYEAADSSHLLLDSVTMKLRTTDGTQLSYVWRGGQYQCTEIKDRNGNFITINYTVFDRISTIVDTLGRVITFNYDGTNYLTSITQLWNGQAHTWASFEYYPAAQIQTNFQGLTTLGPGSSIKAVSQVILNDNSRFEFDYTSWGQIWKVTNRAAYGNVLNYRAYNLPGDQSPQTDCPRFTERHDWAENWNRGGANGPSGLPAGPEQEVLTGSWIVPTSASWTLPDGTPQTGTLAQVTAADGTYNKIYFEGVAGISTSWKRSLPALVETYDSGNARQRQSVTLWTQDNTGVPYLLNPRVTETSVYDPAGNRARTTVTYGTVTVGDGTSCKLPSDVVEFQANATTPLRRSHTTYDSSSPYTSRRIIGLVSQKTLYQVDPSTLAETLMSMVGFTYDESGSIPSNDAPVQHDNTNFSQSFVSGRGNLSSMKRFDVNNPSLFTSSTMNYNTAGAVAATIDPLQHTTSVAYTDNFADGNNSRNTFAYPTSVTDADGFSATAKYNFDFGAMTRTQAPPPAGQSVGAIRNLTYDSMARLEKEATEFNGNADYSHIRYVYPTSQNRMDTYATLQEGMGEAHSFRISDGYGRVFASASDHPGSSGGFSGNLILYDLMGRMIKQSNPTEAYASNPLPTQWAVAGDDASPNGLGWLYAQQTYDWKGRPLLTTNTDGTTKQASYAGCGCAGGAVVTLTDEGTIDGGTAKRRQSKVYSDGLSRTVKTELLNWQGGSPYATTINSYNALDQLTRVRQFDTVQGTVPSDPNDLSCPTGSCQQTTMTYDGYGRLQNKHLPQQDSGATTFITYNPDDTIYSTTDARGTSATYGYNNRQQVTAINYSAPTGITPTPNVTFGYDAAGNRTSVTDGFGSKSYVRNQLSQLLSETRTFTGIDSFTLSYDYNLAGQLKKITDSTGMTINYGYDVTGRPSSVTGSDTLYAGVSNYASNFQYRAWGGLKATTDGKGYVSSLVYNSKLQPTQFDISGSVVHQNYDYYNDGHMRTVHNTTDQNFDRSYAYDQAGRMTEAKSGGDVNGYQYAPIPYHETFGYDAFSNLTARQSDLWNGISSDSDSASYTDNRRLGWGYDADGRNTTINTRTYTFDAIGRQTSMTAQQVLPNGNHVPVTETNGYDADGAMVSDAASGVTTYYLRSSALGGVVIEEISSSGQKNVGHVYTARGTELAQQSGGAVNWKHNTPAGTSQFTSYSLNSATTRIEFDPLGANIPLTAPSETPPSEGDGDLNAGRFAALMDSRWSDFGNLASGCSVAWMAKSCSGSMAQTNLTGQMQAFFGFQQFDLPGNNDEMAQGEARYESLYLNGGYDPEFKRFDFSVTVTYSNGVTETKKNPTLDEYHDLITGYLPDGGSVDLAHNTVTIIAGAEYFVAQGEGRRDNRPLTPNEKKALDNIVTKSLQKLDSNEPCRNYIDGGSSRHAYVELGQIWANPGRFYVDETLPDYNPTTENDFAIFPPQIGLSPKFFDKDVAGIAKLLHVDTETAQMVAVLHETRHATRRNRDDHPNGELDGPEGENEWTKNILEKCFGIKWSP